MSLALADKVVVIAGASTGIGRATARRFAEEGAQVVLLARRKELLESEAAEIGPRATPIVTDVRSPASVRSAFQQIEAAFGKVNVLINSAGVTRITSVEDATDEQVSAIFETNLLGPIYTTRAAIPLLRAAGGGDVVNLSSEITLEDMPLMTLYSASKHGLSGFTTSVTKELRAEGIRVTLVVLGAVGDTSFADNFGPEDIERAWPVWEADGVLGRLLGAAPLSSGDVVEVLHHVVTRPKGVTTDVVHIRPSG